MRERDPIFWISAAVFVLSIVLGAAVHPALLALMAFSYLLRPTLYSLGVAHRYADERQLTIQYRSGNIAFMFLVIVIMVAIGVRVQRGEAPDEYYGILILGIAAKALANVLLGKNGKRMGVTITLAVGSLFVLFGALEEGLSLAAVIHGVPGFVIIALGLLGRRFPRTAAIILTAAAAYSVFFFQLYLARQFIVLLLIPLPLITAAICLFFGRSESAAEDMHTNSSTIT